MEHHNSNNIFKQIFRWMQNAKQRKPIIVKMPEMINKHKY